MIQNISHHHIIIAKPKLALVTFSFASGDASIASLPDFIFLGVLSPSLKKLFRLDVIMN